MTRAIGSAMTLTVAIMTAGCAMDFPAGEGAAGPEQRDVSQPLVSTLALANVLIFGDQITHIDALRVNLEDLGHTVTIRPDFGLPATVGELAEFTTVWHVGRSVPLTSAQQALLAEYLAFGGAVHLTGEGMGAAASNASLTTFVRSVVQGGSGITVGNPLSVPGQFGGPFYPVNANARDDVADWPNAVSLVEMLGAGGISGVPVASPNALAFGGLQGELVVGAIWGSDDLVGDAGKLSILMDSDWLVRINGSNDNRALIENLQEYLIGQKVAD